MRLAQAGVGVGVFAGLAATAALVIWPYALPAEAVLDATVLLALATLVAWIISLFLERINVVLQRITLLSCGALLGAYLAVSLAYFSGFIGYNYPASQQRIFTQDKQIAALNSTLDAKTQELASTAQQLIDAKTAMADPRSISSPSYNLDTSLKLQFDNDGNAQEIEAHNVTWNITPVLQATEAPNTTPAAPEAQQQPTIDCSNISNLGKPECPTFTLGSLSSAQQCPKVQCPAYDINNALLLVLTFPYPIRASDIKFGSYGAQLPDENILSLKERAAIILFHQSPKNLALNIVVVQSEKK